MIPCKNSEETEAMVRDLSEHRLTREPGFHYHYISGPQEALETFEEPDYVKMSKAAQHRYEESARW